MAISDEGNLFNADLTGGNAPDRSGDVVVFRTRNIICAVFGLGPKQQCFLASNCDQPR